MPLSSELYALYWGERHGGRRAADASRLSTLDRTTTRHPARVRWLCISQVPATRHLLIPCTFACAASLYLIAYIIAFSSRHVPALCTCRLRAPAHNAVILTLGTLIYLLPPQALVHVTRVYLSFSDAPRICILLHITSLNVCTCKPHRESAFRSPSMGAGY